MMDKRKDTISQIAKEENMDSYREKIAEVVGQIEDVWILKTIFNFVVGMTKEGN